ncbi:MAG: type II toxin-antitoxin system Phd/YefM family antitoxin [Elusimicrobia bacterium]|nr:type II toxin-antitoxin system Phd/YefM family antitoxin [Elusimicrobiota bacterium]
MDIHPQDGVKPISDFRKDSARVLKQLRDRHEPILLTQRGRSVAVLMDLETFERLEYAAGLRAAHRRGVADLDAGRSRPHAAVAQSILGRLRA